jgi:hypothetical protein
MSPTSRCWGQNRRISQCFANNYHQRDGKAYKFWLNLLIAEEWNYFYLLKEKCQSCDEQDKHIKRLHATTKLASILLIYLNSFVPLKTSSLFDRSIYLNHYERLQCLFTSLLQVINIEHEYDLCSNILERIDYVLHRTNHTQYEQIFIEFPSYIQRTLSLSSNDCYRTLHIMSKDKQTSIAHISLYLILGINLQQNKHLLVVSVEQPAGSNSIHNFHFAHADRSIILQWYQLLDKYVKQAKSDYMDKYQEYRI